MNSTYIKIYVISIDLLCCILFEWKNLFFYFLKFEYCIFRDLLGSIKLRLCFTRKRCFIRFIISLLMLISCIFLYIHERISIILVRAYFLSWNIWIIPFHRQNKRKFLKIIHFNIKIIWINQILIKRFNISYFRKRYIKSWYYRKCKKSSKKWSFPVFDSISHILFV